jgi:glucuronoarabinoxylan endo-1,4-beta-xylanase
MSQNTTNIKLVCAAIISALMIVSCSKKGPSEPATDAATVNLGNTQQVISGFGGVNMPGWIADMTADQVNKAFGTGPGQIGLSILRIRVPYDSNKFNLEVPTAQKANALGITRIFASPWTPPAWMKSNNNIIAGTLPDSSHAAYAAHLKSFAEYMSANGVSLYAISVQNEPDATVNYESCSWNATQMLNFVKNNAPAIGIPIIVPESQDFSHSLSDPILNDATAAANVTIIGGHIYGGTIPSYPLAVSKGKEVWMTEHLNTDTLLGSVLGTAREINDCMNAGMNAYVWWYIRRFYGPIDDNSNVTKRGYVISQYAKFVRPGFYRVSVTANPQLYVYVTAYKNGSNVVIVALNSGPNSIDQAFVFSNGSATSFTPYVTSSSKNCGQGSVATVSGGRFTGTLEPYSVTTFVSN